MPLLRLLVWSKSRRRSIGALHCISKAKPALLLQYLRKPFLRLPVWSVNRRRSIGALPQQRALQLPSASEVSPPMLVWCHSGVGTF
eukprot:1382286-Amphidinium_carterae.1